MSSPMVNGIYYSKMPDRSFMWAMVDGKNSYPAHFGDATGVSYVLNRFILDEKWVYVRPEKIFMIMPEGMYKW